jgi:hypothetical protein
MVFVKPGKIIVMASDDPDQGDLFGIDLLQGLTVLNGDQSVACAMNDIGMASDLRQPPVGSQVIS